jgi:hypothetical protein
MAFGVYVCYNDKAMRGNPKAVKKKVLRNQKKFLTNPTRCGIIRVSRGQG